MAVAFDAVTTANTSSAAADPAVGLTLSHTIVDATNGATYVGIAVGDPNHGTSNVTSVTIGGASATRVGHINTNNSDSGEISLWRALVGTTGAKTINIFIAPVGGSAVTIAAGAISLTGVNQSTPEGTPATAAGSSASPSAAISDSAVNDLILGVQANGSGAVSTVNKTEQFDIAGSSSSGGGSCAGATTAGATGTVTFTWTIASDNWGAVVVNVKASSAGGETITMDKWSNHSAELIAKRITSVVASGTMSIKN